MNYMSPETGIAINVSYGDSMLHSAIVKGPDPEPTCLNIFSQLAQMCARFSELLPTDDGLRGCVNLEPMLLGEVSIYISYVLRLFELCVHIVILNFQVQLELPVGCFRMGPGGMQVIESSNDVIKEQQPKQEIVDTPEAQDGPESDEDGPDTIAGYNTADILAAVNDSAETGIALISNWLGISPSQNETADSVQQST